MKRKFSKTECLYKSRVEKGGKLLGKKCKVCTEMCLLSFGEEVRI